MSLVLDVDDVLYKGFAVGTLCVNECQGIEDLEALVGLVGSRESRRSATGVLRLRVGRDWTQA